MRLRRALLAAALVAAAPAAAQAAMVGFNINANRLASATLTARYGR